MCSEAIDILQPFYKRQKYKDFNP